MKSRRFLLAMMACSLSPVLNAAVPAELDYLWKPCSSDFGQHTDATNDDWNLKNIKFRVTEKSGSEVQLKIFEAQKNGLEDITWYLVRGADKAISLPTVEPKDLCGKTFPVKLLETADGDHTYLVAVADLLGKDEKGEPCGPTPHLLALFPLSVGAMKKPYFAMTVQHLGSECASAADHRPVPGVNISDAKPMSAKALIIMHNGVVHGHP